MTTLGLNGLGSLAMPAPGLVVSVLPNTPCSRSTQNTAMATATRMTSKIHTRLKAPITPTFLRGDLLPGARAGAAGGAGSGAGTGGTEIGPVGPSLLARSQVLPVRAMTLLLLAFPSRQMADRLAHLTESSAA